MPPVDPPKGHFPSARSVISGAVAPEFHLITAKVEDGAGSGPASRCVVFDPVCSNVVGGKAHIWIEPGYDPDIDLATIACCIAPDGDAIDFGSNGALPGSGIYGTATLPVTPLTLQQVAKLLNDIASPRQTYIIRRGAIWCGATPVWLMHNTTHLAHYTP